MGAGTSYRVGDVANEARLLAATTPPVTRRIVFATGCVFGLGLIGYAARFSEVLSTKLFVGLPKLGSALSMMLVPSGFQHLPEFLWALAETIAMGFLGTLLGAVLAVPLALLCARATLLIRFLQLGFRRVSDTLRGLDHLIWALVFVRAIGLGPVAGILAIAIVDLGTLSKLYAEAIDNATGDRSKGCAPPAVHGSTA